MIEAIMYFGIGFLSATLIAVSITPLVHARAVRLTRRRIENALPQSMAEIMADKDLQRADFAVSTRRLETTMEKLRESNATRLAEIGRKDDIINRLKVDRQARQVEMLLLQGEVGSLREQLRAANGHAVEQSRIDEIAMMRVLPTGAAEPNVAQVPASPPSTSEPSCAGPAVTKEAVLHNERDRSDVCLVAVQPAVTLAGDCDAGIPVLERVAKPTSGSASQSDSSIHVSPADHIVLEQPKQGVRRRRTIGLIVVLTGLGGLWWSYSAGTHHTIVSWTHAIIELAVTTTSKVPSPLAEKTSAPALIPQPEQQTREEADPPNSVDQFPATQAESPNNSPAIVRSETPKEALSSPAPQPQPKLVVVPETPPTTIPGWIVREVVDGRAVVQGPNGIWMVARGDTLPGAGRVDSIVRWGHRWIVATNRGLISTP